MPTATEYLALAAIAVLVIATSAAGRLATATGLGRWYEALDKSRLTPPGMVIGAVWAILFASMTVSAWLVVLAAGWPGAVLPMAIFVLQLGLNATWSIAFFGMRRPLLALANLDLLWLAIVATILAFAPFSRLAAGLLLPYLAWVSFAGFLNFEVWRRNPHPRITGRLTA